MGVYLVKRNRFEVQFPQVLVDTMERYRDEQMPSPSRNFILIQALMEFLNTRGYKVSAKDQRK